MKRIYLFKVGLRGNHDFPLLILTPLEKRRGIYPLQFSSLYTPIVTEPHNEMDVSYFLDFKNSLDLGRTSFGESYNLRDKQKKILDDLEKRIDPIVRGVLEGRFDLFERDITIKLVSDDGLSFDFTKRDGIFKKISSPPKRSRNFVRSRVGED